ncbi:hypothetical protein BRADI_3g44167v3, partial [Brachypodium distachyon]
WVGQTPTGSAPARSPCSPPPPPPLCPPYLALSARGRHRTLWPLQVDARALLGSTVDLLLSSRHPPPRLSSAAAGCGLGGIPVGVRPRAGAARPRLRRPPSCRLLLRRPPPTGRCSAESSRGSVGLLFNWNKLVCSERKLTKVFRIWEQSNGIVCKLLYIFCGCKIVLHLFFSNFKLSCLSSVQLDAR